MLVSGNEKARSRMDVRGGLKQVGV